MLHHKSMPVLRGHSACVFQVNPSAPDCCSLALAFTNEPGFNQTFARIQLVNCKQSIAVLVDSWVLIARYHDHGFVFAYIRDFEGMDSGNVTANVVEGKVNKVNVVYVDDNGNPKKSGGETPMEVVERELPFHVSLHRLHLQHINIHVTALVVIPLLAQLRI